jgi:hypothetical protein
VRAIVAAMLLHVFAASAASTISGRVTEAGSGRPLPLILVTLVGTDGNAVAETLTDGDGQYRFAAVAAGRYAVSAAPGEHRSDRLRQWFGEKGPAPRWGRPPRYPLEIADGRDAAGVDIAMLPALAIEGRIISPWEEGMANVPVVAMRPDGTRVTDNPVFSDDLGNFRLYGLAPGRYRVCANPTQRGQDEEGTVLPFVQTCHPSAISEGTAADVTLTSSDVAGIDVRVQRTGGRTVTGTLVDAAGMPANGASVSAVSVEEFNRSGSATIRNGAFSIAGLLPGVYVLQATVGGQPRGDPNPARREREMGFLEVDLAAVDATGVSLAMSKAVTVRGRLLFEGAAPSAAQVSRLVVRATPLVSLFFDHPSAPVRDDATFELSDIFPVPLALLVQGLPSGWAVKGVRFDGRDITYTPANVAAGRGPIEVTITNRLARPVVRVTDAEGRTVPDARVLAVPAATAKTRHARFGSIDGRPDAEGAVKLGPLPAGDYLLVALTLDDLNLVFFDRSRFASLAGIGTMVTLKEDDSPRIDLPLARLPEKR